ncbi:hypothetical protein BGAL_0237g00130 [Botrytis galanthina]|uniref:Uncharacterized protein n=1 Tax=Botrytis galanthina TaxID=278940 RepID=A0A4S8R5Z4_9HELO|nr:hypothetical protein BGAL_0237g00130 [Botrytis galanthina]
MDARSTESPQSYRSGIKRPWEDDTKTSTQQNGSSNSWHRGTLPPIGPGPLLQYPVYENSGNRATPNNQHTQNGESSVVKRSRYEGGDYKGVARVDLDAFGKMPPSQAHYSNGYGHDYSQTIQNASTLVQPPRLTVNGRVDSPQHMSSICRQCRRQTTFDHEEESSPECCEHCQKNPELALVTQACSVGLTQLAETLRSGIDSEKRGINPAHSQLRLLPSGDPPPMIDFGLKQTLHWILTKINKVNELADKFVQQIPPGSSRAPLKRDAVNSVTPYDPLIIMKRRIEDDHQRTTLNDMGTSDSRMHQRRRSMAKSLSEGLPPIRTQSPNHTHLSTDNTSQRLSSMNPPSAPARQLPSPPGRAFPSPSPTSVSFSSPSGSTSYTGLSGGSSQSSKSQATNHILPPITNAQSSDSALQVHTAALQHEVSIQKIALSSLQSEHDKLLAAFSRSQSRASALEKKHEVSDIEIFSLTEEKTRLHAQVLELEGDVEDLAKSRDTYRQAAVQEGAQYVEIVKMASQLEEKTGEERKNWNKLRLEMEQRIEQLSTGMKAQGEDFGATPLIPECIEKNASPSSEYSDEGSTGMVSTESTSDGQLRPKDDQANLLKAEIERLQKRCEEVEAALKAVRQESRSMESIMEALSRAGKGILQKVESVSLSPETPSEVELDSRSKPETDRPLLEE